MTLLEFYKSCCSADWHYDYLEGSAWSRGHDAMISLRSARHQSPAHKQIFDGVELSQKSGRVLPHFGDIVPTDDLAALDEAILHHEFMAQTYYREAAEAEGLGQKQLDLVNQYFAHNVIERRLREKRLLMGAAA